MRVKAALAREINKLTIEDVELDDPKDTELLVRMGAAGVCHRPVRARSLRRVDRPRPRGARAG